MQPYTIDLIKGVSYENLTDKKRIHKHLVYNVLNRLTTIFKWDGLPFDSKLFELMLLNQGQVIISDSDNGLIPYNNVFPMGERNNMYLPKQAILTNPYVKKPNGVNATCEINKNCVLALNDTIGVGAMPHINRMCTLLTECLVSMYDTLINCRMQTLISAKDDETFKSASAYINGLINGDIAVIGDSELLNGDSLNIHPSNVANNNVTELLEMYNTLSAMLYSEYGLNMSTNVKREYVNESETGNNTTMIYNMLECRQKFCDDMKTIYNIDCSVDFNETIKNVVEGNENEAIQTNEEII